MPISFAHYSYQKRKLNAIVLHPYLLKEFQNRWYLIGYSINHKAIRTFGLDRIMNPYQLDEPFYMHPKFDAEKQFKNVYGVYPLSEKIEKIVFNTSAYLSDYLTSQPLHESQKIEYYHKRGALQLSMSLIISQELINYFRMNKDDISVIEPKWVIKEI